MARILDEFPGVPRRVHPWREWLDGRVWELTHGVDFDHPPRTMRQYAYQAAWRAGVRLQTAVRGDILVLRALRPEGA